MKHVVYILGAGFSRPLGLPLISDFLNKAKDMCFSNPSLIEKYKNVLDQITNLSSMKTYYNANLLNIEEVLSIIEMQNFLEAKDLHKQLLEFICEVIRHHTPEMKPYNTNNQLPGNWNEFVFGVNDSPWRRFGNFVASLFNLSITEKMTYGGIDRNFVVEYERDIKTQYSIISLNYDLVLETICDFINKYYNVSEPISFSTIEKKGSGNVLLTKLHGGIHDGMIIPPTWSKGTHKEIIPAWKLAYDILLTANEIRFLGYSLPSGDSYIKYLLKAAILSTPNLQKIDTFCLDENGEVQKRYEDLINYEFFNFYNVDIYNYLKEIPGLPRDKSKLSFTLLESSHQNFCSKVSASQKNKGNHS